MNVSRVDGITSVLRGPSAPITSKLGAGANTPANPTAGEVAQPPNGNPGIVPPWLQGEFRILPWPFPIVPTDPVVGAEMIGIAPVDPDTPHIM